MPSQVIEETWETHLKPKQLTNGEIERQVEVSISMKTDSLTQNLTIEKKFDGTCFTINEEWSTYKTEFESILSYANENNLKIKLSILLKIESMKNIYQEDNFEEEFESKGLIFFLLYFFRKFQFSLI